MSAAWRRWGRDRASPLEARRRICRPGKYPVSVHESLLACHRKQRLTKRQRVLSLQSELPRPERDRRQPLPHPDRRSDVGFPNTPPLHCREDTAIGVGTCKTRTENLVLYSQKCSRYHRKFNKELHRTVRTRRTIVD